MAAAHPHHGGKPEGNIQKAAGAPPEWWRAVPTEEKAVLRFVIGSARVLKRQPPGPMTWFARKWERKLSCFIKMQLMAASRKGRQGKMPRGRFGG